MIMPDCAFMNDSIAGQSFIILAPQDPTFCFDQVLEERIFLLKDIPKHQRVAICDSSPGSLACSLIACFENQLVAVPLDPRSNSERQKFIISHSGAANLLYGSKIHRYESDEPSECDDRLIMYTSGTTSDPKGVILSERNIKSNAEAVSLLHDFEKGCHATALPLWHVNAVCMSLFGSRCRNSPLVLIRPGTKPCEIFAICEKFGVRTLSLVPHILQAIVEDKPKWPSSLDYVISAAAPLVSSLANRFYELYGARLRQGYGLSEATNFSFTMPLLDDENFVKEMLLQYPPVGVPVCGNQFRLVDGEVQILGENVSRGYWRNSIATREMFDNGWLRTGDLGIIRNGFLVINGRKKEIILHRGESISPLEIEEEFARGSNGRVCVALGVASSAGDQEIGLALETGSADEVIMLVDSLPIALAPTAITVESLMRTATGKFQRLKMAERLVTSRVYSGTYYKLLEYFQFLCNPEIPIRSREVSSDWAFELAYKMDRGQHLSLDSVKELIEEVSDQLLYDSILSEPWRLAREFMVVNNLSSNEIRLKPIVSVYDILISRITEAVFPNMSIIVADDEILNNGMSAAKIEFVAETCSDLPPNFFSMIDLTICPFSNTLGSLFYCIRRLLNSSLSEDVDYIFHQCVRSHVASASSNWGYCSTRAGREMFGGIVWKSK